MTKHVFISFGGPTPNYHERVKILCSQAQSYLLPIFQTIAYTDMDLKTDVDFWTQHGSFLETNSRGYGYWLWKPYLIWKTLQTLEEGDVLMYADAGCSINQYGMNKFHEYLQKINESEFGLLAFQLSSGLTDVKYTKRLVLNTLHASKEMMESDQIMATFILMKKTKYTTEFVNNWYQHASQHDLLDDSQSNLDNYIPFIDHRHDQSIYSILLKQILYKKHSYPKPIILSDETFFHPNWTRGINYPIWATRIRK